MANIENFKEFFFKGVKKGVLIDGINWLERGFFLGWEK